MKKLLVHGPSNVDQLVLSFPALHALKKEFSECEVYLAVFEHTKDVINYLSLDVTSLVIPGKYKNIFDAHRFAVNLKELANVDCFLDFESSMTSTVMGYHLKSPEKFGLKRGAAKYLLSNQSKYDLYDSAVMGLVEQYTKKPLDQMKVMASRKKVVADEVFIKEEFISDYLLLILNELSFLDKHAAFFKTLFDGIENTKIRIVYFDRGDLTLQLNEIRDLHASYNSSNKYEYGFVTDHNFLVNQIIQSKGVIAEKMWPALIASYYGVTSFALDSSWPASSRYFVAELHPFTINEKESTKIFSNEGEMAVVSFLDFLHKKFNM